MLKSAKLLLAGLATGLVILPQSGALGFSVPLEKNLGTSPSANYLIGRAANRSLDFDIAARFFDRAYNDDSGNQAMLQQAFVLNVTAGNMATSMELADKIVQFQPDHQLARFLLGMRAAKRGEYSAARRHFQLAARSRIGDLTSPVLIAWTYAAQGKQGLAYSALDALDDQGRLDQFKAMNKALLADFLKDHKTALESFEHGRKKSANTLQFVNAYGTYLWRNGKADKARVVFATYLNGTDRNPIISHKLKALNAGEKAPVEVTSPTDGMFEVLFSLASALSDRQNANIGLAYSQLALYFKPQSDMALVLLGEIYETLKKYKNAISAYEKVSPRSPLRTNADIQIATSLDEIKKSDEAIKRLDTVVAREPNNYDAWSTKGSILYGMKRWDDAAEALSFALARVKKVTRQHWAIYYYRGMSYERAGKWERAEPDFQMALKLRPGHPSVLNYLGYSWIDQGKNLKEALAMVKKAASLRPRDGYIADSVGWALYRLGKYEEAVQKLEQAVRIRPGDPTINDHLGDAYWKVGRKLEARFQWAHARDAKPDEKALKIIQLKLKFGLDAVSKNQ